MASTSKTIGLIALIGGLGAIAYYFIRTRPSFQNVQPAPTTNTAAPQFAQWAALIMSVYGNIAALWKPGGPFHQFDYDEVIDAIQTNNPTIDTNPYDFTTDGEWGWA